MTKKEIRIVRKFLSDMRSDNPSDQAFKSMHKALWSWASRNPSKDKYHWPGWDILGFRVKNNCFGCHYTDIHVKCQCTNCPINYACNSFFNNGYTSLHSAWEESLENGDLESASKFAEQISECWK